MPSEIERLKGDRALREIQDQRRARPTPQTPDSERLRTAQRMLETIRYLSGTRWHSVERIADHLGIHRKSVRRNIMALERMLPVEVMESEEITNGRLYRIRPEDVRRYFGF